MARIKAPIIVAMCHCGYVLVKDRDDSEVYWTKYRPVVNHAKKLVAQKVKIKSAKCPGHGGKTNVKIGAYFHPNFAAV